MEPWIIAVGGAVLYGVIAIWRRTSPSVPEWTDYEHQQISERLWSIEGRIGDHAIRASNVLQRDPDDVEIEIDVSSVVEPQRGFSAHLRSGKVWIDRTQFPVSLPAESSTVGDVLVALRGGVARFELRCGYSDIQRVYEVSRAVISLASRIQIFISPASLIDMFQDSESAYLQEKIFAFMRELHPDHELTRVALENCAGSEHPVLELAAARLLEGERRSALLTKLVEGPHSYDHVRAEALSLLQPSISRWRSRAIAIRLLDGSPSLSRSAAIRLLADDPPKEAPPRLLEIAQHVQDERTATELVFALSKIGGERSVRALEALLGLTGVQREALLALGRCGDRTTLIVLHEELDMLDRAGLRMEANAALAAIRERLGAPDGGRLSLVETGSNGELAVVEPASGLSFPDD